MIGSSYLNVNNLLNNFRIDQMNQEVIYVLLGLTKMTHALLSYVISMN